MEYVAQSRRVHYWLSALLLLAAPRGASADARSDCRTTVTWNGDTNELMVDEEGTITPYPVKKGSRTIRTTGRVCISVVGITTALQHVEYKEKPIDAANLAAASGVFGMLGPLAMDLTAGSTRALEGITKRLGELSSGAAEGSARSGQSTAIGRAVDALQALVDGPKGLRELRKEATLAIGQMAARPDQSEDIAASLKARVGEAVACVKTFTGCSARLTALPEVIDAYAALQRMRAEIHDTGGVHSTYAYAEATRLIDDFEAVVAIARDTEQLLGVALSAHSSVELDPIEVSWHRGAALEIVVEPRSEPALEFIVRRRKVSTQIRLLPRTTARLTLAPVLLYVPSAKIPIYGKTGGTIQVTSTYDGRYAPGVTLGLAPRSLDWRDTGGVAISIPAVTVVPIADYGADVQVGAGAGVGIGVEWRKVAIGAAAYWYRHPTLRGAKVGDPIGSSDTVPVRSTFSGPTLALSLGISLD